MDRHFCLAGPGILAPHSSRGCAFGDFDNDGDLDILVINMNEPPSLLRNDCDPAQHWNKVKLQGTKSNRSAIGARVLLHYGGNVTVREGRGIVPIRAGQKLKTNPSIIHLDRNIHARD